MTNFRVIWFEKLRLSKKAALNKCAQQHAARVFCELKMMKIVVLFYRIIQEKFAYGELSMLVMIGYIFMFKMVKKCKIKVSK